MDAVEASRFITQDQSDVLMSKLMSLTNQHQAETLSRQVYIANRLKSENDEIYNVVDKIHLAVHQNRQISFLYY